MTSFTLTNLDPELQPVARALGFEQHGHRLTRRSVTERFEQVVATMLRQAAGLEPVPWEEALATLVDRVGVEGWTLVGSAALAVRGVAVAPRDVDLVADVEACTRIAGALVDVLVEPLSGGGFLGERWFRAFAGARIEGVGGMHPEVAAHVMGDETEQIDWRGHRLRVPQLELQLESRRRRGLV